MSEFSETTRAATFTECGDHRTVDPGLQEKPANYTMQPSQVVGLGAASSADMPGASLLMIRQSQVAESS